MSETNDSRSSGATTEAIRMVISGTAAHILEASPLSSYADVHDAIQLEAQDALDELAIKSAGKYLFAMKVADDCESELAELTKRRNRLQYLRLWWVTLLAMSSLVIGFDLWFREYIPILHIIPSASLRIASIVLAAPSLIGLQYVVSENASLRRRRVMTEQRREEVATEFTRGLSTAVTRELNAALSRVLDSSDSVPVRVGSIQLVETRGSEVVVSRAVRKVFDFIQCHDASAIGLAGQRGIGKTTILRYLADQTAEAGGLAITITVPVLYEAEAMVRRVYGEFLHQANLRLGPSTSSETIANYKRMPNIATGSTMAIGLVAILAGTLLASGVRPPDLFMTDPLRQFGIALAASGYVVTVVGSIRHLSHRMIRLRLRRDPDRHLRGLLAEGSAMLNWSEERSSTDEVALEMPARLFASKFGSNVKQTERPIGRPELSQHFRHTIENYAKAKRGAMGIVFCIDELDKIEHSAAALQLVNELKDLMHVPGTHFLLSVSEDALRAFSLRGVRMRDAVDSTFDEVFEVDGLTVAESHQVIVQRAPEFPHL